MNTGFKRPESVLVVIYSRTGQVLLLERQQPAGYWQSVTGSLHWDEVPRAAAVREVHEETGLAVEDTLVDCGYRNSFEILPAWRARYAPDVHKNIEHVFLVELPDVVDVQINPREHRQVQWVNARVAVLRASSYTNQAAIERLVLKR